jgi:hypothetical protein
MTNITTYTSTSSADFTPTFLYIKQHTKTNLLYFGQTRVRNIEKYKGSGSYWLRHLKKHGRQHVITVWYCLFTDPVELFNVAVQYSTLHDIVKSDAYANLIAENGFDGCAKGTGTFIDRSGKRMKADIHDARVLSGELIGHTTGFGTFKDRDGNIKTLLRDDPLVLSGEYVGNTSRLKFFNDGVREYRIDTTTRLPDKDWNIGRLRTSVAIKGITKWYNDGKTDYFLHKDDPRVISLTPGRLRMTGSNNPKFKSR